MASARSSSPTGCSRLTSWQIGSAGSSTVHITSTYPLPKMLPDRALGAGAKPEKGPKAPTERVGKDPGPIAVVNFPATTPGAPSGGRQSAARLCGGAAPGGRAYEKHRRTSPGELGCRFRVFLGNLEGVKAEKRRGPEPSLL